MQLVEQAPPPPYRRLIFDFVRQWTLVLLTRLTECGLEAEELPSNETQTKVWDQFTGHKLNTLLVSEAPDWRLPGAHLHQIVILTPLRPLSDSPTHSPGCPYALIYCTPQAPRKNQPYSN